MAFSDAAARGNQVRTNREILRRQAEERNQELQRQGYSFENGEMQVRPNSMADAEQLQAKQTAQLAHALQGKLAAQATDTALEDYALSGDATSLQRALDNDPYLKKAWGEKGVQLINNIDFENDGNLLANAGLKPTAYDTPEKQAIVRKNMYKTYDGKEWRLGLLNNAAAETGALSRMGNRRGSAIINNTREFRDLLNGPKASANTAEGHKYEKEIKLASNETGIPADVLAAMIAVESSGRAGAVSPKGATGLMQLMEDAAAEVGVTDRMDPAQNIMGGAKYLKKQLDAHGGDLELALAAYNAGPGNVQKYGGIPPFGETRSYVQKVRSNLDMGQKYYGQTADIIFDHMRAVANAGQGKTNEQVDQEGINKILELEQENIRLGQGNRTLDQKDRALDQEDTNQLLKLRDQDIKLKTEGTTTKQKDLAAAEGSTQELLEEFGGEDNFFKTDFSDPKAYRQAYKYVNAIEQLEGTELSEADKKNITDVRQLIALGNPAIKLSAKDTGFIDSQLSSLNKYISDEVGGVEAKSAYAAFRNSVRNALFGSALTEGEIKSFDEAYGKLGNKLGPVLQQFKTSLDQVQSKLDSTSNLMNPYSAKVRLGADQDKLLAIRDALQQRIDYLEGKMGNGGSKGEEAVRNAFEGNN